MVCCVVGAPVCVSSMLVLGWLRLVEMWLRVLGRRSVINWSDVCGRGVRSGR